MKCDPICVFFPNLYSNLCRVTDKRVRKAECDCDAERKAQLLDQLGCDSSAAVLLCDLEAERDDLAAKYEAARGIFQEISDLQSMFYTVKTDGGAMRLPDELHKIAGPLSVIFQVCRPKYLAIRLEASQKEARDD